MAALTPLAAGQHPSTERRRMLDRRKSITFKGKLFYLDLPHNKHTQLLTKAICKLGGVIEGFLSRDINYVVTGNKKTLDIANGSSTAGRRGGHSKRQATENIEPVLCRGKQLLKKAIQNQEQSSVLANAHSWGVCILHVDEVLEYLEHSKHNASKTTEGNGAGQTVKVGKLKGPFLKIEDQSRKYRPLQCCFSNFPELSFISSDRSPFETARTNNSAHKDKDAGDQEEDDGERSQRPHARDKSGYCECCQVTYTKLGEHLISEQHSRFAMNASNYKVIDDLACHILCDLMEYPHGFTLPVSEGSVGDGPINVEGCMNSVKEESKMEEEPCPENNAVTPVEGNNGAHNVGGEDKLDVAHAQPVEGSATGDQEEDTAVTMDDGGPVEDKDPSPPFIEDKNNVLLQHKDPLQEICDTETASHVDVVTEVSWYTEEAGLTSVYTVQSLVIPPHGQPAQLTMANTLATFTPPLLLGPLEDPQGAQGTEHKSEVPDEKGLENQLPGAQMTNITGAHCSNLLVKQTSLLEVHEQHQDTFAEPCTGSLCGVHLMDAFVQLPAGERRSEEMLDVQLGSIRLQEQLVLSGNQDEPLLTASSMSHTRVDKALSQGQLNVIPIYSGSADTMVLTPSPMLLANNSDREDQNQLLAQGFTDAPVLSQGATYLGNDARVEPEPNQLNVIPLCRGPADTILLTPNPTLLANNSDREDQNQLNALPLAQGFTDAPVLSQDAIYLGNEARVEPEQSQLNVIPLCQGPADTTEVPHQSTPLGDEVGVPQKNLLNVISSCQGSSDSTEEAHKTTSLGNKASVLQQNSLNIMSLCQGPLDTAVVEHRSTPLGTETSALQQTPLNVISLCQDPAELEHRSTPLGNEASVLHQNKLNVIPLYQDTTVKESITTLDKEAKTLDQNQLESSTDICRGKRKHNWSSSPPSFKRPPCQYQPLSLPVWVFHQLPDSRLQSTAHGFTGEQKSGTKEGFADTPYFSPKLIQYDASSEPDWDLGLLSEQQCKRQQAAQLGDLRTAQVNLDESWYGRQLCSVLAQDQSLGSSSTTPTVTLAHTSYDLYVSEVPS